MPELSDKREGVRALTSGRHRSRRVEGYRVQHRVKLIPHTVELLIEARLQVGQKVQQTMEQIVHKELVELVQQILDPGDDLVDLSLECTQELRERLPHLCKEGVHGLLDLVKQPVHRGGYLRNQILKERIELCLQRRRIDCAQGVHQRIPDVLA